MINEAMAFLKEVPPFSSLDGEALGALSEGVAMEYYPKGDVIVRQDGPAPGYLGIIRSGSVRVFVKTAEGEEVVLESRGKGDFFGFLSLICGDMARNTIVAAEDTTCFLLPKDGVAYLLKNRPGFADFFLRSFLKNLVELTYRQIHDRTLLYGGGDKLLFTGTVGDLAGKRVITASQDVSVQEAARIMSEHSVSSLVLLDEDGLPAGIVTDRDLRSRVVARGRALSDSVRQIMSMTLIKAERREYCYEALLKMIRYNIHHLLVLTKGELSGMITNHDLMMLQGNAPLSVAREIEGQRSIDGLVPVAKKVNRVVSVLVQEGSRASTIARIITEVNDRLLRKVLELVERKMGTPPVGFCWIVFGSEGRKEQTFRTDQDNAIIYEDPPHDAASDAAAYFSSFALQMQEALSKCGFPPCSAGYMASNPAWCQPMKVWKQYFAEWIDRPTPEAVLRSLIFFDFRPVYGNTLLAESLRSYLGQRLKKQTIFFSNMAEVILLNRPPLDILGRFKLDKKGEHKGTFSIKFNALCPIVDTARLAALEHGVYATSTAERLRELGERRSSLGSLSADLEQAFEFLMSLRLTHQFGQLNEGVQPDNFINPQHLGMMDRRTIRESFRIISLAQESIRSRHHALLQG